MSEGTPRQPTYQDVRQTLENEFSQRADRLTELAISFNAAHLFVAVAANLLIAPAHMMSDSAHGSAPLKLELLAYFLYPRFAASGENAITPWIVTECMELLDRLVTIRPFLILPDPPTRGNHSTDEMLLAWAKLDAVMVRGSAYPEQTAEEIGEIQGRFDTYFEGRIGLQPSRAVAILQAIGQTAEKSVARIMPEVRQRADQMAAHWREARRRKPQARSELDRTLLCILKDTGSARVFGAVEALSQLAPIYLPVGRDDLRQLDIPPTDREWDQLLTMIGLSQQEREHMHDPVDARGRPLYVLPGGRVFLADLSNAMDQLWERFDVVARADPAFYDRRYQTRKAKWLEQKVATLLARLFPKQGLYVGLSYPDPDRAGGAVAELDAAVLWGPFLVLIEGKAKQFRLQGQLGDVGRLRTDLKENIEEAFDQARRAIRYIDSTPTPEFTEIETGRKLAVDKDTLRRTYLLTISQHHLAGIATRLASLPDIGLFREREYPLSMSVADLEVIAEFCEGPDVFLHYIERRLDVQEQHPEVHADDLDFFGAYLDTRLQPARLWEREREQFDSVSLLGWADQFNRWMMHRRGELEQAPVIRLKVPPEIAAVLDELRKRDDDGARWIAFALLNLPDEGLHAVAQAIMELRSARLTPGMFRRLVHHSGDTVYCFLASADLPLELLRDRTLLRVEIEKYRRKAAKGIGLGVAVNDAERPFHTAVWVEGEWRHDECLEALVADEPPFRLAPGCKPPGRNAPCVCGSGRKYKKCCLRRLEGWQE